MARMTNEIVIGKCRKVHGGKYDYSKLNYVDFKTKLCIICPKHGEFWQYLSNHVKGCGCPKCTYNSRKTRDEYIAELERKSYDTKMISFEKVQYVNNQTPITLICKEHGEWQIKPTSIKDTIECPDCRKKRFHTKYAKTTETFIVEARGIHGEKYDYSKVDYVNGGTKVCIICTEHGEFWQSPISHLKGAECPQCSKNHAWDKRGRITTESLIERFRQLYTFRHIKRKYCQQWQYF